MFNSDGFKLLLGVILVGLYLGALVALAWHATITGDQAIGAAGAVILPLLGALVHSNGVNAGASAATPMATTRQRHE